jgi:hypothetical protein
MLARLGVLGVFGVLLFSLVTVGGSLGVTESVDVIVLLDRNYAPFGATINVTVEVLERAVLVDPSAISAAVNAFPGITPLTLTRDSVGVFKGAFVFKSHPSAVFVNATVGGIQDSGTAAVFNEFHGSLSIVPSAGTAKPGDRLSVAVEVRGQKDGLEDPISLELTADVVYAPGFEGRSVPATLNLVRTAVGKYWAAYTVPANIVRDAFVEFAANVELSGGGGAGAGSRIYIDFPDPFVVWYRTLAIGPTGGTLEIDVASTSGNPLSNASVAVRTPLFPGDGSQVFEGATDASGAVRFEIPVNASIPTGFYGNATYGVQRQAFYGSLGLPLPSGPREPELFRENPDEIFEAGETAVLRFRLMSGDVPIPDQELYVYAHTTSEFVTAKKVMTDQTGRFDVRFVSPAAFVGLDVAGAIEGTWRYFHLYFSAVSRLAVVVSSQDGRQLTISGRFPSPAGPWIAQLSLSTEEGSARVLPGWTAGGSFGAYRIAAGSSGEAFAFDVPLPRFLPEGQEITVSIYAESFRAGGGTSDLYEFRKTVVVGTPITRPIDLGVLIVLLAMGLLIAVPLVLSQWRRPPRPERLRGTKSAPRQP